MQRTCTAEETCKAKVQYQHTRFPIVVGGGAWMGWAHPSSYDFFRNLPPPPPPPKPMPYLWGTPATLINETPSPHLKNKPPPLKRETPSMK